MFVTYFINNIIYILIIFLNQTKNNFFILISLLYYFNYFSFNYFSLGCWLIYKLKLNVYTCEFININLIYGLANTHPLFFYMTILFLFINFFLLSNLIIYFKVINILYISLITMFLGGLWSTGNSSWGFFWLNDPIELVLLFIIILILIFIHAQKKKNNYYNLIFIFLTIILYLFFFRLGFILTRHNFFNLKTISNTFIFFIFLFFTLHYYMPWFLLFLYNNLVFLTLYVIFFYKKYLYTYTKKNITYHILIFSLIILFLKYKENNISIFLDKNNFNNNYFFFFEKYNYFFNYFYIKGNFNYKFFLSSLSVYSIKLLTFNFFSFLSYWNYIFLMLFLISTLKIVPN